MVFGFYARDDSFVSGVVEAEFVGAVSGEGGVVKDDGYIYIYRGRFSYGVNRMVDRG